MITTTLGMLLCLSLAKTPFWAPEALLDTDQFTLRESQDTKTHQSASFTRDTDQYRVLFSIEDHHAKGKIKDISKGFDRIASRDVQMSYETTSGLPIGDAVRVVLGDTSLSLTSMTPLEEILTVLLPSRADRIKPGFVPKVSPATEIPFVESLARESLAKFASRRLEQPGTVDVDGTKVASFTAKGTGAVLLDLAAWAKAKGYAVNLNAKEFRASFSTPTGDVLVCAASPKSKLGDKWVPMPDIAMLKDGKLWAPYAFLKNL